MDQQHNDNVLDPRLIPAPAAYPQTPFPGQTQHPYAGAPSQDVRRQLGPRDDHMSGAPSGSQRADQPYHGYPAHKSSEEGEIASIEIPQTDGDDYSNNEYGNQSPSNDPSADPKRPRACEACRGLKVRCDQDPSQPDRPCRRCAKAGRQCVITQPSRKRQKKSDNRVAELEKKLDALTAALHSQQQGGTINLQALTGISPSAHETREEDKPISRPGHDLPSLLTQSSGPPAHPSLPWTSGSWAESKPDTSAASNKRRRTTDEAQESRRTPSYPISNTDNRSPASIAAPQQAPRARTDKEPEVLGVADPILDSRDLFFRRQLYHADPDVIIARIRSIVEPAIAKEVFHRYVNDLAPHLPAVVFPAGTTADEVLESKPVLFLCILAAAGQKFVTYEVGQELSKEAVAAIADCVVRNAAKSLELIQALQVAVLWWKPPDRAGQANFYQFIHMAAVMALDIGLGKRFNAAKARRGFWGSGQDLPPGQPTMLVDSDTVEARRAWLACYYLCASTSMVLRRPNLIRWTNYMHECVEVLETSPDALPSDRYFVQHIRIQHLCEDIGSSFSMDDSSATTISISDPKVTYALTVLENQLNDWESNIPDDLRKPELLFFKDVTSLYLHEIALHVNHNTDDFKIPFTEESLKSGNRHLETLTPKQMAAVEACLSSTHRMLDTYCNFGPDKLQQLPTLLYFVRCIYAVIVLIKLHIAVTLPDSELGKIVKKEDLKASQYLDGLWKAYTSMKVSDLYRQHHKILRILGVLREWFGTHHDGDSLAQSETDHRPKPTGQIEKQAKRQQWPPKGDSRLHVLSEAAAAGSDDRSKSNLPHTQQHPSGTERSWTFDSPSAVPYSQTREQRDAGNNMHSPFSFSTTTTQNNGSLDTSYGAPASSSTVMTPFGAGNTFPNSPYGGSLNAPSDNFDWTAGLDFEQAVDMALRDFDMSGDLGDWFVGDGPGAFQLPPDPAAPGAAKW